LSQKRHKKNLKRKSKKPKISKSERKIERIRAKIISDALTPIRTNLLSNLDKKMLEGRQSSAILRSKIDHPNSV
jgi:hypothetical protein